MPVSTRAWLAAAGTRALYTVLAALLPLAGLLAAAQVSTGYALSVAAAAGVLSLATSLASIPEVEGQAQSLPRAVVSRVLRTVGQVGVPALTGALLVTDVDWPALAVAVGGAALTTLIRTLMGHLPEVAPFADA